MYVDSVYIFQFCIKFFIALTLYLLYAIFFGYCFCMSIIHDSGLYKYYCNHNCIFVMYEVARRIYLR